MRFLRRTSVVVLLGVGATLLTSFALTMAAHPFDVSVLPKVGRSWPRDVPAQWPSKSDQYFQDLRFGAAHRSWMAETSSDTRATGYTLYIFEVGLPAPCFTREYWQERHTTRDASGQLVSTSEIAGYPTGPSAYHNGVNIPLNQGSYKKLYVPVRPMWTGLIINIVFYSSLFLVAIAGLGWFRRIRGSWRARKGVCPACAYEYPRDAENCPECGAQLHPAVTPAT